MTFTKDKLASFLREIADLVETGDSLEGTITYTALNATRELRPGEIELECAVRVGNREGQGGIRLIPRSDETSKEENHGRG